MEEILKLVLEDLRKRLDCKEMDEYDEIPYNIAKQLLDDEGILIYSEFKDSLTTPWAVARYISLYLEEKELIERVTEDLKSIPKGIEITFIKRLSCNVQFTKEFEEGVKRQALIVKYYLDADDNIQYKLTNAGSNFCWDITKSQLRALLANQGFTSEKIMDTSLTPKKPSKFKRWLKKILGL